MRNMPALTESLCPHCLCRVTAHRITEDDAVFLEKTCREHGKLERVLLWRNSRISFQEWNRGGDACLDQKDAPLPDPESDCPFACGLCPDHGQETCTAIIEVTRQCNLQCPVCFASSTRAPLQQPEPKQIVQMLRSILDRGAPCPIQFSGGEPTLRDDLPELVAMARDMGFDHIQINTNGIRLAEDAEYAMALKRAGVSVVFLQFDGVTDDVYVRIRGTELLRRKEKAVERCAALELGVILVPTIVRGINDGQAGAIIDFAGKRIPTVKGVHFQPMTYLGRYPETPANDSRMLIPDLLDAIEKQTNGELKLEHFLPPGCEESHCSFSAFAVLGDDGRLMPTTRFDSMENAQTCCSREYALRSREFVRNRWRYSKLEMKKPELIAPTASGCGCNAPGGGLFDRARTHSLCISGMAFQDVWNIDLERLRHCCVHVVAPDARMIPFCAYYMTGTDGRRLYTGDFPER